MKLLMDDIGEVTFLKNGRSKSLRISVKPFKGINVTLPNHVSYNAAISFVNSKKEWIKKSVGKIKNIENQTTIFDENTVFNTKYHQIKIIAHHKADFRVYRQNGFCYIQYPATLEAHSPKVQDMIKAGIVWLLKREAKSYLPFRVMHLAQKHKLDYAAVRVKNIKTRWGSCSYNNNINLNIHLMRLPDHLIDYVILHELAHTVHKNHSALFWEFLDGLCGNSKKLRSEVRNFSTAL